MEKALLIQTSTSKKEKMEAEETLLELKGLAGTAGADVVGAVIQHRSEINPKFLIGKGKVEEIISLAHDLGAEMVIFDHDLTPIQQRSLEDEMNLKVIDRTQLILDIFSQRAHSREGKLQVELAQLSYMLPRLSGKGSALSRLGGGIGTRGPGEKKLEEDRRKIKDRISRINREIKGIQKRRADQRKSRLKSPVPFVSLVGYTSAGKSTLFNILTRENTMTSSQLFSTLDPIHRRVGLSDGTYFFLSDTVGFIKKLPPELIVAFKATLEEVTKADCICHVVDITSPNTQSQVDAVDNILEEMGAADIPAVTVYNKIDLLSGKNDFLERNKDSSEAAVYISAKAGLGILDLRKKLSSMLFHKLHLYYLKIPRSEKHLLTSFPKWSIVLKKIEDGENFNLKIMADPELMINYLPYIDRGDQNW